jgi:hypothetical protein
MTIPPAPTEGVRLNWADVPEHVRHALEAWAGAQVLAAHTQPSGFSPGVAARLRLADKRSLWSRPSDRCRTRIRHHSTAARRALWRRCLRVCLSRDYAENGICQGIPWTCVMLEVANWVVCSHALVTGTPCAAREPASSGPCKRWLRTALDHTLRSCSPSQWATMDASRRPAGCRPGDWSPSRR